ncbi:MAG: hypothetical protein C0504_06595 [Candidatus Solibacter sp.]|nr:hypothetical protein [Candidatus Solibacter sp.]
MHRFILAALALQAIPAPAQTEPDVLAIVRKSLERDWSNYSRARDYTYVQRAETRKLDGKGAVTGVESKTWDVIMIGERPYRKLIAEDDKPLDEKQTRKAAAEFEKAIRKNHGLSEGEIRKRAERQRKDEEESRRFLREIPEAFDFEIVRRDVLDGMPVWVIRAEPKPGYRPRLKDARILTKFRGVIWIDEREHQWVKVEAEVIDTVSFGLVLARLGKGTALTFMQSRVNDEVWLPSAATTRINARLALLKTYRAEVDVRWRDYRKFRTESRVVAAGEEP